MSEANLIPPKKVNETDVYQIDAKINGNRFVGTAKSLINENTKTAPFIKQLFSGAANPNNPNPNSDTLEGGFYGESGDELAGKFLSNDNATYVVFGGKRDKTTEPVTTKKRCILVQALKNPTPVLWIMKQLVRLLMVKG